VLAGRRKRPDNLIVLRERFGNLKFEKCLIKPAIKK
jgi:hypothetical protein